MKHLIQKEQSEDLEKYKKWLEGDNRYAGFGSQLDLKNKGFLTERKEKTSADYE